MPNEQWGTLEPVQGLADLQAKLKHLGSEGSSRVMRSALGAANTALAQALRAAVNASSLAPTLKRAARQAIGKRYGKRKGGPGKGQMEAKAGFAVGKKPGKTKDRGSRKGVGISAANIHWVVLGTKERKLKGGSGSYNKRNAALIAVGILSERKGLKAGHRTGKMPAVLAGVTATAVTSGGSAALAAARAKFVEVTERESRKKG